MTTKVVANRQKEQRLALIEQLKKMPIVGLACEKVGLHRSTYYRWLKENKRFATEAHQARREGVLLINDLAESQLLSQIKEGNITAMIFWLKHNNPTYETRIAVRPEAPTEEAELSTQDAKRVAALLESLTLPKLNNQNEK